MSSNHDTHISSSKWWLLEMSGEPQREGKKVGERKKWYSLPNYMKNPLKNMDFFKNLLLLLSHLCSYFAVTSNLFICTIIHSPELVQVPAFPYGEWGIEYWKPSMIWNIRTIWDITMWIMLYDAWCYVMDNIIQ